MLLERVQLDPKPPIAMLAVPGAVWLNNCYIHDCIPRYTITTGTSDFGPL